MKFATFVRSGYERVLEQCRLNSLAGVIAKHPKEGGSHRRCEFDFGFAQTALNYRDSRSFHGSAGEFRAACILGTQTTS
jgi:hypothetical protein